MADFIAPYWSLIIAATTLLSLLALLLFLRVNSRGRGAGEEPQEPEHVWDGDLRELNNPLPQWWLNLFYLTIFFGIAYLLLYPGLGSFNGLLQWSQQSQYDDEISAAKERYDTIFQGYAGQKIEALAADPEALAIGQRLFSNHCATCHGADAGGRQNFPSLRDDDWLYGGEPETIETSIKKGRRGMMPAWESILTPEQIESVARFVQALGQGQSPAADGVFQQNCAACHGPGGEGNQALGAPRLNDQITLYGASYKDIYESIEDGRQGNMPAHEKLLDAAKIRLLAAYVYGLSK